MKENLWGLLARMDGKMRDVYIYQRDFRTVQGVTVPLVLESAVDGYRDTQDGDRDRGH